MVEARRGVAHSASHRVDWTRPKSRKRGRAGAWLCCSLAPREIPHGGQQSSPISGDRHAPAARPVPPGPMHDRSGFANQSCPVHRPRHVGPAAVVADLSPTADLRIDAWVEPILGRGWRHPDHRRENGRHDYSRHETSSWLATNRTGPCTSGNRVAARCPRPCLVVQFPASRYLTLNVSAGNLAQRQFPGQFAGICVEQVLGHMVRHSE